jgi:tetratricopeptide (TPR) repeat protein
VEPLSVADTTPVEETPPAAAEPAAEEGAERAPAATQQQSGAGIVAIVAEKPQDQPKEQPKERKEYARKSDWLRAQFLPEVEALDFSGLFVGNLGLGIREEKTRRNVVLADPSRITEVLLRANGYRRNGDHAKALISYQELVDMDAANADFRFLLGKTLLELGQREQAMQAFLRAKELGHEGAEKEMEGLKRSGHRPKAALGFLRFWKQ